MAVKVLIKRAGEGARFPLPSYQTEFSAGADLYASEELVIPPGEWRSVRTGICLAIPVGYEVQVRPRSGLAFRRGVTTLNAPGTIDADYRGEIHVILINHGKDGFAVKPGDRIAQMVLARVERFEWDETDSLPESERGQGGFGSTGF